MASEKHLQLSEYIKGVHQTLRLKARALGADEAWQQHCQQTQLLEKYAENMKLLATEFWGKNCENNDLCRIQWVLKESVEYFYAGGYERAYAKEEKLSQGSFKNHSKNLHNFTEKSVLKLLDVGSCYNPFSKFSMFDVTAIDIAPATHNVLKCDFLSVEILDSELLTYPKVVLPLNNFEVVVFSLLLEYLPSSKQRFKCCENAYRLLRPGGLLFILTPDSKHETANSKVMKSWRHSLASIGFLRLSYQKLKHLHCMAYRKCHDAELPKNWLRKQQLDKTPEDMMYIPQDTSEYCRSSRKDEDFKERSETDSILVAETFCDFPDSDLFL